MIENFAKTLKVLTILLLSIPCKSLATVYYVNINNPTPGTGTSWATAFNDLSAALAVAEASPFVNYIWVAKGIYKPTASTDRTATFLLKNAVYVYGGFSGVETALGQQDPVANPTILSGDIGVAGDLTDNSYHVVTCEKFNSGTFMNGFTIEYGYANAGYPGSTVPQEDNTGGGVLLLANPNDNSVGWIQYCTFTSNFAVYGGGYGAYGDGTGTTGGNTFSAYKVNNCIFTNNGAVMGGAIGTVATNQVWSMGTIQNCIFTNNSSTTGQGSVIASIGNNAYSDVVNNFNNSVLYNNPEPIAYSQCTSNANPVGKSYIWIINNIVWRSGTPYGGPLTSGPNAANISFTNCDLDLVTPLGSNLDADPQFINAAGGDFHVASCTSPVIDQGWPVGDMVDIDLGGNSRVQGSAIDIGAYEQAHPLAPAVSPPTVTYCLNATASPLAATAASGDNLLWYTTAAGGSGSSAAPTPSTSAATTTYYYVSQEDAAGCEGPRASIQVTVSTGSTPPAASPVSYCQNAVASPLTATGTNLLWYTAATGGTGSATAPTPPTAGSGSTDYYVTQTPGGSCESSRTAVDVTINPAPSAEFTWSTPCEGKASTITATNTTADTYTWDFGSEAAVTGSGAGPYEATWATSKSYMVTLTATTAHCPGKAQHLITVNPNPKVMIAALTVPLCQGNNISLEAYGAATYQWSPAADLSDPIVANPVVSLQSNIQYTVTGTDANGCSGTAQIALDISPDCIAYFLPNAFTPNGDGKNDAFRVRTADVPKSFTLLVFNRYGGKVFESSNIASGWNGTIGSEAAPNGTYVYSMLATTSAGTIIKKQGTVILLR